MAGDADAAVSWMRPLTLANGSSPFDSPYLATAATLEANCERAAECCLFASFLSIATTSDRTRSARVLRVEATWAKE